MKLAMVGLGKMGANMARRLVADGYQVVVYDVTEGSATALASEHSNIQAVLCLKELSEALPAPRAIWLMVPHQFVDQSIEDLQAAGIEKGDLIIDRGNSNFNLSKQRAAQLSERGIHFVDSGASGGVWGLENGYSMMLGSSDEAIAILRPALQSLAPAKDEGWGHVGPPVPGIM